MVLQTCLHLASFVLSNFDLLLASPRWNMDVVVLCQQRFCAPGALLYGRLYGLCFIT